MLSFYLSARVRKILLTPRCFAENEGISGNKYVFRLYGYLSGSAHPGDDVSDKRPDLEFREIASREAYGATVSDCILT